MLEGISGSIYRGSHLCHRIGETKDQNLIIRRTGLKRRLNSQFQQFDTLQSGTKLERISPRDSEAVAGKVLVRLAVDKDQ